MVSRILEVPVLPDLSMHRYAARYGPAARELAAASLAGVVGLLPVGDGEEVGVRYLLDPAASDRQQRLRILLKLPTPERDTKRGIGEHLLRPFYSLTERAVQEITGGLGSADSPTVVHCVRQAVEVSHAADGFSWSPVPFGDATVSRTVSLDLDDLLDGLTSPCALDVLVKPERVKLAELRALVKEIEHLSQVESFFEAERRERGSRDELAHRRDPLARRCREYLEELLKRLVHREVYAFTLRVVSADGVEGGMVARSVALAVAGGEPFEVTVTRPGEAAYEVAIEGFRHFTSVAFPAAESEAVSVAGLTAEQLEKLKESDPARERRLRLLSGLRRLVDGGTMVTMLRLPTSGGVPLKTVRIESEQRASEADGSRGGEVVVLGREMERERSAVVPLDQLGKHAFVAGTTGSGKTTTVKEMLVQLWEGDDAFIRGA